MVGGGGSQLLGNTVKSQHWRTDGRSVENGRKNGGDSAVRYVACFGYRVLFLGYHLVGWVYFRGN